MGVSVRVGEKIRYSILTDITASAEDYYNKHCPSHNNPYTTRARYNCTNDSYNSDNSNRSGNNSDRSNNGIAYGC